MKIYKFRKLATAGFSHLILPIATILIIGAIGGTIVAASHADAGAPETGPSPVTTCTTAKDLVVDWRAVGGSTKYEVAVYNAVGAVKASPDTLTVDTATFSVSTATESGTVKVRAGNSDGWGPWSATKPFNFKTDAQGSCSTVVATSTPATAPADISTSTSAKSGLTVSWKAVGGALVYQVDVIDAADVTKANPQNIQTTSANFSEATSTESGTVKVRAGDSAGFGPWSAVKAYSYNSSTSSTTSTKLISLGGSIIAGAGASNVSYDNPAGSSCARSSASFALLTAQAKGFTFEQFACSGATMENGILGAQTSGSVTQATQMTQAAPYVKGNDIVIMVGGNDTGWIGDLSDCLSTTGCPTTEAAVSTAFQSSLTALQQQLTSAINTLKQEGAHTIVVDGYYPIADSDSVTTSCTYHFTTTDINWMNSRMTALNNGLAAVTKATSTLFVNPAVAFTGYGVCVSPSDSYIQGAQGTHADYTAHPDLLGQKELAKLNEAVL